MAFPNSWICYDLVKDDSIGKVNVAAKVVSKRKKRPLFLFWFPVALNKQGTKSSCSHQQLSITIFLADMRRIYQLFRLMSRFRWKSVKALTACPLSCNCPLNFYEDQLASSPTILYPAVLPVIRAVPYLEVLYLCGLILFVKIRWYESIPFIELFSDAGCQSTWNGSVSVSMISLPSFVWSTSLILSPCYKKQYM